MNYFQVNNSNNNNNDNNDCNDKNKNIINNYTEEMIEC